VAPQGLGFGQRYRYSAAPEAFRERIGERSGRRERRIGKIARRHREEPPAGIHQRNRASVCTNQARQMFQELGCPLDQSIAGGNGGRDRSERVGFHPALPFLGDFVVQCGEDFRLSFERKALQQLLEPAFGDRGHDESNLTETNARTGPPASIAIFGRIAALPASPAAL